MSGQFKFAPADRTRIRKILIESRNEPMSDIIGRLRTTGIRRRNGKDYDREFVLRQYRYLPKPRSFKPEKKVSSGDARALFSLVLDSTMPSDAKISILRVLDRQAHA